MSNVERYPTGEESLSLLRQTPHVQATIPDRAMAAHLLRAAAVEIEFYLDAKDVRRFSSLMVAKLARKGREGSHGWRDAPTANIRAMLIEHIDKDDMVDVANLAMMVHYLSEADPAVAK